jgi:hypothetical protein
VQSLPSSCHPVSFSLGDTIAWLTQAILSIGLASTCGCEQHPVNCAAILAQSSPRFLYLLARRRNRATQSALCGAWRTSPAKATVGADTGSTPGGVSLPAVSTCLACVTDDWKLCRPNAEAVLELMFRYQRTSEHKAVPLPLAACVYAAIVFWSIAPDGRFDAASLHGSCPVIKARCMVCVSRNNGQLVRYGALWLCCAVIELARHCKAHARHDYLLVTEDGRPTVQSTCLCR